VQVIGIIELMMERDERRLSHVDEARHGRRAGGA
jgi:hypothetical protein